MDPGSPLKVTLTGATTATPSFTPTVGATYWFQLVVTDQFGAVSNSDLTTVQVNANRAAGGRRRRAIRLRSDAGLPGHPDSAVV
jgi:hypothetical protein